MTEVVERGTETKISEQMVEEMRREIGIEYPAQDQWNTEANRDAIKHWAEGVGDLNPLWLDSEYAAKTRYGRCIAPPSFLISCWGRSGRMGFPGIHALQAGVRWSFYKPLRIGDSIAVSGGVQDVVEKKSAFALKAYAVTSFYNFRNQRGELVAKMVTEVFRMERDTAAKVGKYKAIKAHVYTEPELQEIWRGIEAEEVRGANARYWEDVHLGQELTPIVKGPLTLSDVIAFKMAWGNHLVHHFRANEARYWAMKRHPKMPIRNRLNVPDSPEGVHMLNDTSSAIGIPGFYDYGFQRAAWAQNLMTHWIGDDGWLRELDVKIRRPNMEGDTQWFRGHVANKWVEADARLVEVEYRAENQRGETTTNGFAVVELPSRS